MCPGLLDLNRAEARLDLGFSSGVSRAALSISLLLEQEREKAGLGAAAPVSREHWGGGNTGGRGLQGKGSSLRILGRILDVLLNI